MVTSHLENKLSPSDIAEWLNKLPPVNLVLANEFNGGPITEADLEQWRRILEREKNRPVDLSVICTDAVEHADRIAATGLNADKLLILLNARIGVAFESAPCLSSSPCGKNTPSLAGASLSHSESR